MLHVIAELMEMAQVREMVGWVVNKGQAFGYRGNHASWTGKLLTSILCLLELKTITTYDIKNLTTQMHELNNCQQIAKRIVSHMTITFYNFHFQ